MAPFPLHRPVVMSGTGQDKLNHLSEDCVHQFKPREREIIIEAFLQTTFLVLFSMDVRRVWAAVSNIHRSQGESCSRTSAISVCSLNSMRNSGVMSFMDIWNTRKESISLLTLLSTISSARTFTSAYHVPASQHPSRSAGDQLQVNSRDKRNPCKLCIHSEGQV